MSPYDEIIIATSDLLAKLRQPGVHIEAIGDLEENIILAIARCEQLIRQHHDTHNAQHLSIGALNAHP